jgi:predicted anti-sigma-YlaC factor YlaD
MRVGSVGRTPDLTASILTTVGVPVPRSRPQRFLRWVSRDHPWRAALAVTALAQLALGLSQIFGIGHDHGGMVMGTEAMTGHLFNESTAWNLAVGVGFLFAAWRPAATNGLLPVLATFTGLLTVFVITDSIAGQVTAERVASHAIIAVGVLVTVMVRHRDNDTGSPTPHRLPADPDVDIELPDGARYGRRRGHLRDTNDPAA